MLHNVFGNDDYTISSVQLAKTILSIEHFLILLRHLVLELTLKWLFNSIEGGKYRFNDVA
jgi:hypothetical protein